eukprot:TRINITY_DN9142_c0_g2_i1.p1 TRINITY_DN9142_c0_g2~~TRINITY_DN9142_c0_g2_i1.p1  ORF type:complete len:377 (+),score=109.10 TRINITY_DN9142_c0_g2_i1:58-1188(+)
MDRESLLEESTRLMDARMLVTEMLAAAVIPMWVPVHRDDESAFQRSREGIANVCFSTADRLLQLSLCRMLAKGDSWKRVWCAHTLRSPDADEHFFGQLPNTRLLLYFGGWVPDVLLGILLPDPECAERGQAYAAEYMQPCGVASAFLVALQRHFIPNVCGALVSAVRSLLSPSSRHLWHVSFVDAFGGTFCRAAGASIGHVLWRRGGIGAQFGGIIAYMLWCRRSLPLLRFPTPPPPPVQIPSDDEREFDWDPPPVDCTVDHYATLELPPTATQIEIRVARNKLSRDHHPDKQGGSLAKMQAINAAFCTLSDQGRRAAYDRGRGQLAPTNTAAVAAASRLVAAVCGGLLLTQILLCTSYRATARGGCLSKLIAGLQ